MTMQGVGACTIAVIKTYSQDKQSWIGAGAAFSYSIYKAKLIVREMPIFVLDLVDKRLVTDQLVLLMDIIS
jgi:hypothetical protein